MYSIVDMSQNIYNFRVQQKKNCFRLNNLSQMTSKALQKNLNEKRFLINQKSKIFFYTKNIVVIIFLNKTKL